MNRRSLLAALLAAPLVANADAGDSNLDTPFVITPQRVVDVMLELAAVGPNDRLLDLGSGDGRIVITAAQRWGTRGIGVDLDPRLVAIAERRALQAGVADKASFRVADLFETDLTQATVITMYLLPDVNAKLKPRLQALKPGTRIVSHDYGIGDWEPDRKLVIDAPDKPVGRNKTSDVMLWVVR